jgi:hypothetical protein
MRDLYSWNFLITVAVSVAPPLSLHSLLHFVICPTISESTMATSLLLSILPVVLLLASLANAEVKPYINTTTEIPTECKTCPRSLCPNKVAYTWDESFNVTCWTRGTKIMSDRLWLKSGDGCYVTQWDVIEYPGDCELSLFHHRTWLMTGGRYRRPRVLRSRVRRTTPNHRGRDTQVQE